MVENEVGDKTKLILEVAQKRFAFYGLLKTSMNEIAADAAMSKASLYYYFKDKETIFKEVVKREQKGFIDQIKKSISKDASASNLLVTYVKKRLEYFEVFLNLSKLNTETIKSVKPIFSELAKSFNEEEIALVASILDKGMENGEFEKANTGDLATLFVQLMQSMRSNIILRSGIENIREEDLKQLRKQFISIAKIFGQGIKYKI